MDKTVPIVGIEQVTAESLDTKHDTPLPTENIRFSPPTVDGDLGFFVGHRVVRFVGCGAMGAVYEAVDVALQRKVALKVMLPHLAATPKGRRRFLHEARAVAKLSHPCIVRIYSTGIENDMPYLTMEYLEGLSLEQYIKENPSVPIADVVRIVRSLALGLLAAHSKHIVHRDVKPDNIWIERHSPQTIDRIVILDFGLAVSNASNGETIIGKKLVGTPNYLSPEAAVGQSVDSLSDMFSVGCILYRLLTNRLPFSSDSMIGLLSKIAECRPVPVAEVNPEIPEQLAQLTDRLLSKNPAERPTPTAIVETLQQWETGQFTALRVNDTLGLVRRRPTPTKVFVEPSQPAVMIVEREPMVLVANDRLAKRHWKLLRTVALSVIGGAVLGVVLLLARQPKQESAKPSNPSADAPKAVALFNGVDLQGWHARGKTSGQCWTFNQQRLRSVQLPTDHYLLSVEEYTEFEVQFQYRWLTPGGHTGFYFRAVETPNGVDGLAVNMGDDEGFPAVYNRSIGKPYQTGNIRWLVVNPISRNRPLGEWNTMQVTVTHDTVEVRQNGFLTAHLDVHKAQQQFPDNAYLKLKQGPIALESHWGNIEYQALTIRPITSLTAK